MTAVPLRPDAFRRPFIKMHGLGNHFVIVDARAEPYAPDVATIRRICDPRKGVGADQLVVIEAARASGADAFMRLYNVDGREVGACGNATRCVAWLLMEEQETDRVAVQTLAGVLGCKRSADLTVTCDMGELRSDWQIIPLSRDPDSARLDFAGAGLTDGVAANIGNPHVVFFVDDPDAVDIEDAAPKIQADSLFPESVNVSVASVTASHAIRLIVYERGAGLTTACGSGACATVWAARRRHLVEDGPVDVTLPGGTVRIEITGDNRAIMTGPVAYAFKGEL